MEGVGVDNIGGRGEGLHKMGGAKTLLSTMD